MKVALCFSGMPRFVSQTHAYWTQSIISRYKPDVFVHTWAQDKLSQSVLYQQIQSLYQPTVLWTQAPQKFDTRLYADRIWPHRTTPSNQLSQYTSIKHSLSLCRQWEIQNGFKYDIVVRARFDWFLNHVDFELNNCVNVAHTPTLSGHKFTWNDQTQLGISDQFAYGNSDVMNTYSQLVTNLPNLYSNYGIDFCGELFLKAHLLYHNIDVVEHKWQNGIVRDDGIMP